VLAARAGASRLHVRTSTLQYALYGATALASREGRFLYSFTLENRELLYWRDAGRAMIESCAYGDYSRNANAFFGDVRSCAVESRGNPQNLTRYQL
jgi:hypothetical protein